MSLSLDRVLMIYCIMEEQPSKPNTKQWINIQMPSKVWDEITYPWQDES